MLKYSNNSKDYKLSDFVKEVEAIRLDTSKDGYLPYTILILMVK